MGISARFDSPGGAVDADILMNSIAQGDDVHNDNFNYNSSDLESNNILPRFLATPVVSVAATVLFSDDVAGNTFGEVLGINHHDHNVIKPPGRFQSSSSKPLLSNNSNVLVHLL